MSGTTIPSLPLTTGQVAVDRAGVVWLNTPTAMINIGTVTPTPPPPADEPITNGGTTA